MTRPADECIGKCWKRMHGRNIHGDRTIHYFFHKENKKPPFDAKELKYWDDEYFEYCPRCGRKAESDDS
ncbi:MAG: hypothetical protein ACFFCW_01980 [Candidatus Hodarchaeota archaeon]